jgi:hypothetical protein
MFKGLRISLDSICEYCGRRYGEHSGDSCPEEYPLEKFWECYVEGTDGGRHYKWDTLEGAQIEAERLARLPNVHGKTVYLFECVGKCKVEPIPVKWDIPR